MSPWMLKLSLSVLLAAGSSAQSDLCLATCPEDGPDGAKIADPYNCSNYYVCSAPWGDHRYIMSNVTMQCQRGMFFNASAAECAVGNATEANPWCALCDPCAVTCSVNGTFVPDPYDCRGFYNCFDGNFDNPPRGSCDDGLIFDYATATCAAEGNQTRCFDACDPCKTICVGTTRVPKSDDCRRYHYCDPDTSMTTFFCGERRFFNPVTKACEEDLEQTCEPVCKLEDSRVEDDEDDDGGVSPALVWSLTAVGIVALAFLVFALVSTNRCRNSESRTSSHSSSRWFPNRIFGRRKSSASERSAANAGYQNDVEFEPAQSSSAENVTSSKPAVAPKPKLAPVPDPAEASNSRALFANLSKSQEKGPNKSYLFQASSAHTTETQA